MSNKKWGTQTLVTVCTLLLIFGGLTAIIDPFFHYHPPLKKLAYPLNYERYINAGIVKHFDYNAIITGTSMTQNFKTSEFDTLFGTSSIKVPFSGASFNEVNNNLNRALSFNPNVRFILRSLDLDEFIADKDSFNYTDYPEYLYDDIIWNDTSYVFNKSILINNTLNILAFTKNGGTTYSFDKYDNWMALYTFGREAVYNSYSRLPPEKSLPFTEADELLLKENISQNVTAIAEAHPEITFYLFMPPYSICRWDQYNQFGTLEQQLIAIEKTIELLIPYENIKLFSFFDAYSTIENLENYKDTRHYSEDINSQILRWMAAGEHQITKDNYKSYCQEIWDFYTTYDYDSIFAE